MIRNLVFVATVATTLWGSIGVYATPIDQIIINLPLSPAEAVLVVNPAVVEPDTSLSAVGGKAPDPPKNTLGAVIRTYGAKKGGTSKCSVNPTDRDISWTGCWFLEDDYAEVVYQLCGDLVIYSGNNCDTGSKTQVMKVGTCTDISKFHSVMLDTTSCKISFE